MQIGLAAFFSVFFMIYYYDIRVRREGLDLELAAARLRPPAAAAAGPA
jgi:hypothetical protein